MKEYQVFMRVFVCKPCLERVIAVKVLGTHVADETVVLRHDVIVQVVPTVTDKVAELAVKYLHASEISNF